MNEQSVPNFTEVKCSVVLMNKVLTYMSQQPYSGVKTLIEELSAGIAPIAPVIEGPARDVEDTDVKKAPAQKKK